MAEVVEDAAKAMKKVVKPKHNCECGFTYTSVKWQDYKLQHEASVSRKDWKRKRLGPREKSIFKYFPKKPTAAIVDGDVSIQTLINLIYCISFIILQYRHS